MQGSDAESDHASGDQTFGYDYLNRLQSAQTTVWGDTYGYDSWGNLLQKTPMAGLQGESMSVTANTSNQISGQQYALNGAVKTDNIGANYIYDAEGRMTEVSYGGKTNYTYDGTGARVMKSGAVSRLYWYGAYGEILNESDSSGNVTERNVYFNGNLAARYDTSGSYHLMLPDHLGSTRIVINNTGAVEDDIDYYPFGAATPASMQTSNDLYKFTDYEHDSESGTEHAWYRNLSSSLGRYMRPNPQSSNRYSYVSNRVLNFIDPSGLILRCYKVQGDSIVVDGETGEDILSSVACVDDATGFFGQGAIGGPGDPNGSPRRVFWTLALGMIPFKRCKGRLTTQ